MRGLETGEQKHEDSDLLQSFISMAFIENRFLKMSLTLSSQFSVFGFQHIHKTLI